MALNAAGHPTAEAAGRSLQEREQEEESIRQTGEAIGKVYETIEQGGEDARESEGKYITVEGIGAIVATAVAQALKGQASAGEAHRTTEGAVGSDSTW